MDIKRMLKGKTFWLALLIAAAGMILGTSWPDLKKGEVLPCGTFLSMAEKSLESRTVLFFLPVAAALPYGEEYLRERQWNFLRFFIIRRGKSEYCRDKVMTTALSGMLVWTGASAVAVLIFFMLFFGKEEVWNYPEDIVKELLGTAGRVGLIASGFSSLSACCAAASHSVYMAIGFPFIFYYMLIILRQRYLEAVYCMDPSEWISPKGFWGEGQRGLWIFLLLLVLFMMLLHGRILEKRLEEI